MVPLLRRDLPTLALLAATAAAVNWYAPTVFFDSQIMLGGSLAVFALLRYGWAGLAVGLAALAVTVIRWGHPFELLIGSGFLIWLGVFLNRFNGSWEQRDNGRILLAALGFWLLLGIWLEVALFHFAFQLTPGRAVAIALKEAVTGLVNTALGFLAFIVVQWWVIRGRGGDLSIRGLAFAVMLAAMSIPAVGIMVVLSRQLSDAALGGHREVLERFGQQALAAEGRERARSARGRPPAVADKNWMIRLPDGARSSSDPELFARLEEDFILEPRNRTRVPGLFILRPREPASTIQADAASYWLIEFPAVDAGDRPVEVSVVEPIDELIGRLDYDLLLPAFATLLGVLAAGIIVSEGIGFAVQRQFDAPLHPLRKPPQADRLPELPSSGIRELNALVAAVNERGRQVADLAGSLRTAQERLRETAYDLTENIPVGTYTMVLPPAGGLARFEFMSTRFLELTGLEREAARADPLNAFACVHPEDRDEWIRKNAHAFEHKLPFREECRVVVKGETRWIIAESRPRDLPDGSVVWEGVLTDISNQKRAERELAASRQREREAEERMRETLRQKLKTSLTAAAVAHEINQPLSRILLRAQLDRAARGDADGGGSPLDAMIADAERVVLTIQKMNVLLRNVETVQQAVDLDQVVTSGMVQLKPVLRRHGVTAHHRPGGVGCVVQGDDVQLQTVVINLVRNAAEAIGGASSPEREVLIECHCHDDRVELVVGDSGPGWPGGTIDELLLASTKPEGTGIGLFVVKTAVENHRGTISIGRSPLGGAEFRIVFPRATDRPAAEVRPPADCERAAGSRQAGDA